MDVLTLKYISTFSATLPIIAGSFVILSDRRTLFFWVFLVYGFITDFMNFLDSEPVGLITNHSICIINQNLYSLVDGVFLFYFLSLIAKETIEKAMLKLLAVCCLIGWICFYLIFDFALEWVQPSSLFHRSIWHESNALSAPFDSGYEAMLAFASAYLLLRMTQPNRYISSTYFWITIGIFCFSFGTFFINYFIDDQIVQGLWFVVLLDNVLTMLIYTYAFILGRKAQAIM
jgi:hypothetical protein